MCYVQLQGWVEVNFKGFSEDYSRRARHLYHKLAKKPFTNPPLPFLPAAEVGPRPERGGARVHGKMLRAELYVG